MIPRGLIAHYKLQGFRHLGGVAFSKNGYYYVAYAVHSAELKAPVWELQERWAIAVPELEAAE